MSVANLGSAVTRVIDMIAEARRMVLGALRDLSEAENGWGSALAGTQVPETRGISEAARNALSGIAHTAATLDLVDGMLRRYLSEIGYSPTSSHSKPRAADVGTTRAQLAKQRIGQRPDGAQARGEWVRSDGWSTRLVSGTNDSYFQAAKEFAQTLPAPDRAAQRLATHVEIKIAVAMRREGLTDETVVIDRGVCGTREYDAHQRFTCDKYLSTFLPPGACLRVVQADGTIKIYRGKAG